MEEDADGSHVLPASQLAVATALLPMLTGGVLTPQATTLLLTLPPSNTKKNKWGLRGIRFDDRKKAKKWEARITIGKKDVSCGYYATKEEAGKAFDLAVIRQRGKRAARVLNFPTDADVFAALHAAPDVVDTRQPAGSSALPGAAASILGLPFSPGTHVLAAGSGFGDERHVSAAPTFLSPEGAQAEAGARAGAGAAHSFAPHDVDSFFRQSDSQYGWPAGSGALHGNGSIPAPANSAEACLSMPAAPGAADDTHAATHPTISDNASNELMHEDGPPPAQGLPAGTDLTDEHAGNAGGVFSEFSDEALWLANAALRIASCWASIHRATVTAGATDETTDESAAAEAQPAG